jgi:hypothetical protein
MRIIQGKTDDKEKEKENENDEDKDSEDETEGKEKEVGGKPPQKNEQRPKRILPKDFIGPGSFTLQIENIIEQT